MSESKHTPGPWVVDPDNLYDVNTVSGDAIVTAFVVGCEHATWAPVGPFPDVISALSNANLIAAAPEMYELLRDLAEYYPQDSMSWPRIAAVLAKAEGRS